MDHELSSKVEEQAKRLAKHSWEYGVVFDALLETHNPELTVFSSSVPPPAFDPETVPALEFAKRFIRTDHDTLIDGEGSAGDPASLGIPALMLGISNSKYAEAARRQKLVLLERTPRWANGAISHRVKRPELWSDAIYMMPPFLAYFACMKTDRTLLIEASRQCISYREVLKSSSDLWMHIASHGTADPGLWSTGNGWAVMGMTRVLAMIKRCNSNPEGQEALRTWAAAIESSIWAILQAATRAERHDDGLLSNYINDRSWFGETAGTAAIASAILRMATLSSVKAEADIVTWALSCRETVLRHVSKHDGIVSPVVNPLNTQDREPAMASAEGQAFALLLEAAYRDWEKAQGHSDL